MEMEEQKNIFNSLGPVNLGKNEQVYTEALNYAISNDEIKNIAITGTYASGKSSVWETFKNYKKFGVKDVLTVSLGNYENTNGKINENSENKVKEIDNRVEKQIINQILSQINASDIPLSKYSFKENKSEGEINHQVSMAFLFLVSLMLLYFSPSILNVFNLQVNPSNIFFLLLFDIVLFMSPVGEFLHYFFKNHKFKFLKIKIKEAEADLNYQNGDDETILDRNIKEIVYLLASSRAKILVFEDLDRFNNVEIFVKLKEFNFLVNAYLKTTKQNRVVKFVYLIKDGLFSSKDRTKFFDFILPIVPILDSKTSVNKFLELISLAQNNQKPQDVDRDLKFSTILSISSYVDDMRLLKNIVNEYIIYSSIVPIDILELDTNKLFALITLKNIFPNEFELLQEHKGEIIQLFNELENYRDILVKKYEDEYNNALNNYSNFEQMTFSNIAKLIPDEVTINSFEKPHDWVYFLRKWHTNNEDLFVITDESKEETTYTYEMFFDKFIYTSEESKSDIELQISRMEKLKQIVEAREKRKERDKQQARLCNYQELLNMMNEEEVDQLFNKTNNKIRKDNYFQLIKYLLLSGLLDDTYWYYKSSPVIEEFASFKLNDLRFMIGLFENRSLDVFLKVESPKEIIKQLSLFDFSRKNILNLYIFKQCLNDNNVEHLENITDSVRRNANYINLIKILRHLVRGKVKLYVDFLIKQRRLILIKKILKECHYEYNIVKNLLLHCIFISQEIDDYDLLTFKNILETSKVRNITFAGFDENAFFERIKMIDVKFRDLSKARLHIDTIRKIEKNQLYELNMSNVKYIASEILQERIDYGKFLDAIFYREELISTKEYIKRNFVAFISLYIDENSDKEYFYNNENTLFEILSLENMSEDKKLDYLKYNKTKISKDLPDLSNKVIKQLLDQDNIQFNEKMIRMLWLNLKKNIPKLGDSSKSNEILNKDTEEQKNNDYKYEESFVNYICKHITPEFIKETKDNNLELYNYLVNCPQVRNCFEREAEILR